MFDSVEMVAQLGGEVVIYEPYGRADKQFKAIVERRPTQTENAGGFSYGVQTLEVFIPNDETNGMTEIQERKDTVRFKKNLGDSELTRFTVQKIMQEDVGMLPFDSGMFHVLVQA